jgi:hypothetical protein
MTSAAAKTASLPFVLTRGQPMEAAAFSPSTMRTSRMTIARTERGGEDGEEGGEEEDRRAMPKSGERKMVLSSRLREKLLDTKRELRVLKQVGAIVV